MDHQQHARDFALSDDPFTIRILEAVLANTQGIHKMIDKPLQTGGRLEIEAEGGEAIAVVVLGGAGCTALGTTMAFLTPIPCDERSDHIDELMRAAPDFAPFQEAMDAYDARVRGCYEGAVERFTAEFGSERSADFAHFCKTYASVSTHAVMSLAACLDIALRSMRQDATPHSTLEALTARLDIMRSARVPTHFPMAFMLTRSDGLALHVLREVFAQRDRVCAVEATDS